MSEESFREWQKSFTDIEESIEALYRPERKAYNKRNSTTTGGCRN